MLFGWIRKSVRNAVLSGINDAVDALEQDSDGTGREDALPALSLRLRLVATPALPAAEEGEAPTGGKRNALNRLRQHVQRGPGSRRGAACASLPG
jgi:hypothetical protein